MARKPTPLYIIGKIIKLLGLLLLTFIIGLLLWRVYISTIIPREIKRLAVNDSLVAAYEAYGDELEMFRQDVPGISREKHNYGYFSVEDYVIIPEADQVQVIFRYNNSTIERLAEDLELSEVPGRETDIFELSLVKTIAPDSDKSEAGDDTADGQAEQRYFASGVIRRSTLLYNYRRVVFEGVSLDDAAGLSLEVYYIGRVDYNKTPLGQFKLYSSDDENIEVKLSGVDKQALKKAAD
ncbi:MAG: hypothetical protein ACOYIA_00610 [Eubacteriales bacterium]|jgi:hypothetical protein